MDSRALPKSELDRLLRVLTEDGFEVVGPRIEQGAIVYSTLKSSADLPIGWTDRQAPGSYRLEKRGDDAYFGYAVGPHSWKKYLFPPLVQLWRAHKEPSGFRIAQEEPNPPRLALLGVRSCELHAIAIQDRVFMNREGGFTDDYYAKAERLFLIAVECEHPAATCFCTSMGTGPAVRPEQIPLLASRHEEGARQVRTASDSRIPLPLNASRPKDSAATAMLPVCDLILNELDDVFLMRAVSGPGQSVLDQLQLGAASPPQQVDAEKRVTAAAEGMGRRVDATNIRKLLHENQEHPRWNDVANRCLACTNCTLVCPTCFCSTVEDVTDLAQETADRVRCWDSCFNPEFGRVHGGNFRPSVRGRYRQWLTHKFASWFDQFDVSGCVGCGRCITWCPVGIDVTQEITAIRATDGQRTEKSP